MSALPDPEVLVDTRQRWVTERFATRVVVVVLYAALFVNLTGVGTVAIAYRWSQPVLIASLGIAAALPTIGMIVAVWANTRRSRTALAAAREVLGLEASATYPQWVAFVALVGVALLGFYAQQQVGNAGYAAFFAALGAWGASVRRWQDPATPAWGLAFMTGWMWLGAGWMVAFVPAAGADLAFQIGVWWVILAPFGLPLLVFRKAVVRLSERPDRLGAVMRAWAVFLPPAEAAKVRRLQGEAQDALALLQERLRRRLWGWALRDALLEAGEILSDLEDPRTAALFAAAAEVSPDDARPFVGLARAIRGSDLERAIAYARFAEENAARALSASDPAIAALREELERERTVGDPAARG